MTILGWIIGVLFIFIGSYCLIINKENHYLLVAEVAGMQEHGLFDGEEDYMRDFRVGRAQGELFQNERNRKYYWGITIVGFLICIFMALP